jgi:hypothetical protein
MDNKEQPGSLLNHLLLTPVTDQFSTEAPSVSVFAESFD